MPADPGDIHDHVYVHRALIQESRDLVERNRP